VLEIVKREAIGASGSPPSLPFSDGPAGRVRAMRFAGWGCSLTGVVPASGGRSAVPVWFRAGKSCTRWWMVGQRQLAAAADGPFGAGSPRSVPSPGPAIWAL